MTARVTTQDLNHLPASLKVKRAMYGRFKRWM